MTGERAYNPRRPKGQENLVEWLRPELLRKHRVKHIMDQGIKGQYSSKVVAEMGRITLSCVSPDPKNRPHMKEVVDVLERIQCINVVTDRSSTKPTVASSSRSSPHHYQYGYRAGAAGAERRKPAARTWCYFFNDIYFRVLSVIFHLKMGVFMICSATIFLKCFV